MTAYIDPRAEQIGAMMKLEDEGPIHMLNMIRFREKAAYEDGRAASGAEAYGVYSEKTAPFLAAVGGRLVSAWAPQLTVIGAEEEAWDTIFVVEYPDAAAFMAMIQNPEYQKIVHHRQAAVADSRLIRLKPAKH